MSNNIVINSTTFTELELSAIAVGLYLVISPIHGVSKVTKPLLKMLNVKSPTSLLLFTGLLFGVIYYFSIELVLGPLYKKMKTTGFKVGGQPQLHSVQSERLSNIVYQITEVDCPPGNWNQSFKICEGRSDAQQSNRILRLSREILDAVCDPNGVGQRQELALGDPEIAERYDGDDRTCDHDIQYRIDGIMLNTKPESEERRVDLGLNDSWIVDVENNEIDLQARDNWKFNRLKDIILNPDSWLDDTNLYG